MNTHIKTDPCRRPSCLTQGCIEEVHHHDRDGHDCGRCGKDDCPSFDGGTNWWAVLVAVAIVGALLAAILGRLVGWL